MRSVIMGVAIAMAATAAQADEYSKNFGAMICLLEGVAVEVNADNLSITEGRFAVQAVNRTNLTLTHLLLEVPFEGVGDPRDSTRMVWTLAAKLAPGDIISGQLDAPDGAKSVSGKIAVANARDQFGHRVVVEEAMYSKNPAWPDLPASQDICVNGSN